MQKTHPGFLVLGFIKWTPLWISASTENWPCYLFWLANSRQRHIFTLCEMAPYWGHQITSKSYCGVRVLCSDSYVVRLCWIGDPQLPMRKLFCLCVLSLGWTHSVSSAVHSVLPLCAGKDLDHTARLYRAEQVKTYINDPIQSLLPFSDRWCDSLLF